MQWARALDRISRAATTSWTRRSLPGPVDSARCPKSRPPGHRRCARPHPDGPNPRRRCHLPRPGPRPPRPGRPSRPARSSPLGPISFEVDFSERSLDGFDDELSSADHSRTHLSQHGIVGLEELPKGTVVGRYVIVDRIGTGGMGSVYAAYDPELDRKVAVKVLHAQGGSQKRQESNRARLVREAQALAKLSHPAVVTVHDVGLFGRQVFMAMEFVEGQTLADWMTDKHPWREVVKVFKRAGEGLAAAHAAGLVHRDFKPTNVILSGAGRVRILDFGLARRSEGWSESHGSDEGCGTGRYASVPTHVGPAPSWGGGVITAEQSSLDLQLTRDGSVMGSPAYMAPEQHMSKPTDARSDIYSFCATMYEALYGERPYVTEDPRMMMFAIQEGRLHKPSRDSGVPGWLRKALLKGLAVSPEDRYERMEDLLAGLSRDPRRRLRNVGLVLAGVVALGGLGAGVALPYLDPPVTAEVAINSEVDQLVDEAHEAAAKALYVYPPPDDPEHPTALRKVKELESLGGDAEELAQQRARELREEFGNTLAGIGDRYWAQDDGKAFAIDYYAQALLFDDSLDRAKERAALTVGQLASLSQKAAGAGFSRSELEAAESLAVLAEPDEEARQQKLESMLAQAEAGDRSLTAQAQLEKLARRKAGRRKPKPKPKATPEVPEVDFDVDAEDAKPTPDQKSRRDPNEARELAKQGHAALRKTQWADAERLFHKALELDRKCGPALMGLSDMHFERSEYASALKYAERAVAASPKNAGYRIKLGDVYYKVVRYTEAKEAYEAAQKLGSSAAEAKLAKINSKLGG